MTLARRQDLSEMAQQFLQEVANEVAMSKSTYITALVTVKRSWKRETPAALKLITEAEWVVIEAVVVAAN